MFIEVVPLVHLSRPAPRTLTYRSQKELAPGSLVRVPLRHRYVPAVVMEETHKSQKPIRIRDIAQILTLYPILPSHLLDLGRWISEYYVESLGLVLRSMLPSYIFSRKGQEIMTTLHPIFDPPVPHMAHKATTQFAYGAERWKRYDTAIRKTLARNQQVLFLIPEYGLMDSTNDWLSKRFPGAITIFSGSLSPRQQWERWRNIAENKTDIMLGTRAAVFAPLTRLGLIIVERESGSGYKSFAKHPRYRAQDVAFKLAAVCGAHIILGDSAPSVERWEVKPSSRPSLLERSVFHQKPGGITIVDARQTTKQELVQYGKAAFVISAQLKKAAEQTLKKKKGVLMFAARRGAATSIACADCGWVAKCDHCEAPLAYYAQDQKQLRCRHCGTLKAVPATCAKCRSWRLNPTGLGTQEVARVLKKIFSETNIEVFDGDTAATAKRQHGFLERFRDGKTTTLVATQLIFNKPLGRLCGLIGVVRYDQLLAVPEFRAEEEAYRTLLQLSALLEKQGRIIVQTFNPGHRVLRYFRRGAYENFLKNELGLRKKFRYPPFWQLIKLTFEHKNPKTAAGEAHRMAAELEKAFRTYLKSDTRLPARPPASSPRLPKPGTGGQVAGEVGRAQASGGQAHHQILGPVPAFIPKIHEKWQWNVILKIRRMKDEVRSMRIKEILWKEVPARWDIDVDPDSIL